MSHSFITRSASFSDVGTVRKVNEDSCLDLSGQSLWLVADGMGGHSAGDLASGLIVGTLRNFIAAEDPGALADDLEDALIRVNKALYEKSMEDDGKIIGSTVACWLSFDRFGLVAWAGDSRVYRLRDGAMERMMRDHSEVEDMIEQGRLAREDAEKHPEANVINRAVGGAEEFHLEFALHEIRNDDRILICSDGLYKDLSEAEIATWLKIGDPQDACDELKSQALQRECADNVTAIVVDFLAPSHHIN
jgi:serine/threonine protein phosphatase PrpC